MTRPTIDYTSKDSAALTASLLELARERLPVWRDFSPNDLGVVLLEAFAYLGDLVLYYQDRIANESYLDTAVEARSVVNLLRLIGYELEPSKPASVDLDLLFDPDDATGTRTIPTGAEFRTTRESAGADVSFRYLGPPLTIDLGSSVERPANVEERFTPEGSEHSFVRFGAVGDPDSGPRQRGIPVTHVEQTLKEQVLGSSDASKGQRFAIRHSPVIETTLQVFVVEGMSRSEWTRVRTLLNSKPTDKHYQVRRDESERVWVEFGNGIQGIVPPRNVDGILASYLVGGGARGNVPKESIVKLGAGTGTISGLRRVYHAEPASGGTDREPLAVAAERAPFQFRSQDRVVTDADHVAYALEFGVAKARAFRGAWNRVRLYVAPAGGGRPSDTLLEHLRTRLEEKRVMTTVLEVLPPSYVSVKVAVTLSVEPNFFQREVEHAADAALRALLAFENVDFGQTLYVSKLYEALEALPGVSGAVVETFELDRPDPDARPGVLRCLENEIPRLTQTIDWAVSGGQR